MWSDQPAEPRRAGETASQPPAPRPSAARPPAPPRQLPSVSSACSRPAGRGSLHVDVRMRTPRAAALCRPEPAWVMTWGTETTSTPHTRVVLLTERSCRARANPSMQERGGAQPEHGLPPLTSDRFKIAGIDRLPPFVQCKAWKKQRSNMCFATFAFASQPTTGNMTVPVSLGRVCRGTDCITCGHAEALCMCCKCPALATAPCRARAVLITRHNQ
eukprot:357281-Chlamydomonas_euryale.AAC.32